MQPLFDFSVPVSDLAKVGPTGNRLPPVNGTTPQSRHASWSGAVLAAETRSANIALLRQLWQEPHTMHEIADLSGLPIESVCSLKSAMASELSWVDYVRVEWGLRPDGRMKVTRRSRWQLRACAQRPTR